ncbi:type V CRISPR-associated protein Cas12k [Phormidesmis priestleyi]
MSFKTIRSLLCATEETREYLWHLFLVYTLLINQLLEKLPQKTAFAKWRKSGRIPRKAIVATCNEVLKKDESLEGLPARFYTSAVLSVSYTFASIFAIQKGLRAKCEGKQRWLNVAEKDLELAQTTSFSPEAIRAVAAQVVDQAEAERQREFDARENRTGQPLPLMTVLFKFWDKTKSLLRRRAIAHLLRNDCKVNPEQSLSERTADLSTQLKSLPYPLLFGSTDDLRWSWEKEVRPKIPQPVSAHPQASADPAIKRKPKRCRTHQRKKSQPHEFA